MWRGQLEDFEVSVDQVTLPVVVVKIITQKRNRKSKIKVLEKDIKENATINLSKTEGQNTIGCGHLPWWDTSNTLSLSWQW